MRKTTVAIGFLLTICGAQSAQAQQIIWEGTFRIVKQNAQCAGQYVGFTAFARLRPPGIAENGDGTRFSINTGGAATSFRLQPGAFDNTFKVVDDMGIGVGHGPQELTPLSVKFKSTKPAVLTADTPFYDVVGQIKGWFDDPGCIVDFNMGLLRQTE